MPAHAGLAAERCITCAAERCIPFGYTELGEAKFDDLTSGSRYVVHGRGFFIDSVSIAIAIGEITMGKAKGDSELRWQK